MVTTSSSTLKVGARSSCRRNEPLSLCPNRTQPFSLDPAFSTRHVGVGWIVNRLVSLFDTVMSQVRRHSYRPPAFSQSRQLVPQGARLKAADAGTRRLRAGPSRGSKQPKGLARAALKAAAYRLRPEDLPPAEMRHEISRLY